MNVKAYLKQPTTIHGIAYLAATVAAVGTYFLTKSVPEAATVFGGIIGVVNVGMPDNSALPTDVEKLVVDALTAAAQKKFADAIPTVMADAKVIVTDAIAKTPSGG